MKILYVLRHAKSSWDNPNIADFDRPLNERGLKTAPFVGEIMLKNNFQPEFLISSPAIRARETADLVKISAHLKTSVSFDERIYEASPQTLLHIVSELNDSVNSAMIIGHNPGLEALIKALTGEFQAMPTAGLAVIDLDTENWSSINSESGKLRTVIRPKEKLKNQ
jgi:phosphohistidine phosphatase